MSARCGSCKAEIWWTRTQTGALMPVDPPPVVLTGKENVAVSRTPTGDLHARVLTTGQHAEPYEKMAVTHFTTCVNAASHRRPR